MSTLRKPDLNKPAARMIPGWAEAVQAGRCTTCGKPVDHLRDELSEREYSISGMCQTCQDSIFRSET